MCCGSGRVLIQSAAAQQQQQQAAFLRAGEAGMTLVSYDGSADLPPIKGAVTGISYVFNTKRLLGYVDNRDLAYFRQQEGFTVDA